MYKRESRNILDELEQQGYTRQELHALIHKIVLHEAALNKKYKKRSKYARPFRSIISFMNQVKGKALALLRSQFAKKPKQPV